MSDTTRNLMRQAGIPLTRRNYLAVEFLGAPPDELDGEQLAEYADVLDRINRHLILTAADRKFLKSVGIKK
jgi:hypothetical protein